MAENRPRPSLHPPPFARPREATDRLHVEQRRGAVLGAVLFAFRPRSGSVTPPEEVDNPSRFSAESATDLLLPSFGAVFFGRFLDATHQPEATRCAARGRIANSLVTRGARQTGPRSVKTFEISSSWGMVRRSRPHPPHSEIAPATRGSTTNKASNLSEAASFGAVLFASVKARAPVSEDRGSREVRDRRSARGLAHNIVRAVGRVTCRGPYQPPKE